jgi:hypothetical protein
MATSNEHARNVYYVVQKNVHEKGQEASYLNSQKHKVVSVHTIQTYKSRVTDALIIKLSVTWR